MTLAAPKRLIGRGVSPLRVAAIGDACGAAVSWREPAAVVAGGDVVLLVDAVNALTEDEDWAEPFCGWVEVGSLGDVALGQITARALGYDLFCSLATASSADFPLAGRLVWAIAQRRTVDEERMQDMELALHEAVSNALVHGNLGVASMRDLSIAALDSYSQCICDSLANPALAGRRLEVMAAFDVAGVVIDVVDEGAGYDAPDHDGSGACGRGLDLISSIAQRCEIHDGGRRISIRFDL